VEPAIAEQPFEDPAAPLDGAIVDAGFVADPAGAPLEAVGDPAPIANDADLARLHAVPVELAVEIGRTRMTIGDTLGLGPGSIITLNRMAGEPVDLLVNGRPIARGEVVVIDEEFGLRVTEVLGSAAAAQAAG
jgi:flagellar motor switch protein FliN